MATVSDVTVTPISGMTYIDALLDMGPDWNFLPTKNGLPGNNTLYYTFSITSGNEKDKTGQEAFTLAQQVATRTAFDYISKVTGIQFVETVIGTDAQIHLCNIDIVGGNVTGLCSWQSSYSYLGTELRDYDADAWVYLDNAEWRFQNRDLTPGGRGYQTLLHELGHALGLKHPFDEGIDLPASQDTTLNTLMSYTDVGGPYSAYQAYDLAALKWLYGGDGLGGALGINSITGARYIAGTNGADTLTGTGADDTLEGDGGNDMIIGGDGIDTAVFRGIRSNYTVAELANGDLSVASRDGIDGVDTLRSIEILKFADMSVSRADVVTNDTTAPNAPQLAVTKNANGYATTGFTPVVTGQTEANAVVKLYTVGDNKLIGTATADAKGVWSIKGDPFPNGTNYTVYATATDAAGNTSVRSEIATFSIDGTAPVAPTVSLSFATGSNQATFSGTGEAGTIISLMRTSDFADIAYAKVGTDGTWQVKSAPLPNGAYDVIAVSSDLADNASSSKSRVTFTVSNADNMVGTTGKDVLKPTAANNAIDGLGGLDTAVYTGARAGYSVVKGALGYDVTDHVNGGIDSLINVERVQFSDGWLALDLDGTAGKAFRLYQAAFDRPAEAGGLGFWIYNLDNGVSMTAVANGFLQVEEFKKMYGANPTDAEFVTKLYEHVMHRAPDAGGFDFWMNNLQVNHMARAEVLTWFSESPENQAQVIGSIQDGITYTAWQA